jgi:hypothetical protein
MVSRALISVSALLLLCGCQTDGSALPSVACTIFKPIYYSPAHDTRETARQVVAHNAVGKATCGWRPINK